MGGATATRRWPFAVNSDTGNRTLPRQGAQLLGEADAMFGIHLNEAAGRTAYLAGFSRRASVDLAENGTRGQNP